MIHSTNPDRDLPPEDGSARRRRLVEVLRLMHQSSPQFSRVDDAVMRAIHAAPRAEPETHRPSRRLRLRLAMPLAATLAVVAGLGAYVHQQAPATVSAQTILQHAARAGLVPNRVTHFVYRVTSSAGYSGTTQFWVQAGASGTSDQIATEPGAAIAIHLAGALEVYGRGSSSFTGSQFVGHTMLDGMQVNEVRPFAGGPTAYVDAQNYIVRGVEWTEKEGSGAGSTWRARLLHYGKVPASSIPVTVHWHP